MLRLNGRTVEVRNFPDGTLLLKQEIPYMSNISIDWRYENDEELFALYALTRHLQAHGCKVSLFMPYIPNARMDRVKNSEDVFTLRYFAEIINSLGFENVGVLDPHSSVSEALIERLQIYGPDKYINDAISRIGTQLLMFYPDEGAMKRYSGSFEMPYAFGVKTRDWKTGNIMGLQILGNKDVIKDSDILIVDDICSRGGTFFHSAKALKELGARKIYLYVTHCENTVLQGEMIESEYIEKIFTTDSIYTAKHEKVEVIKL